MYTMSVVCLIPRCKQSERIDWVVKLVIDSESKEVELLSGRGYTTESTEIQTQNLRKDIN